MNLFDLLPDASSLQNVASQAATTANNSIRPSTTTAEGDQQLLSLLVDVNPTVTQPFNSGADLRGNSVPLSNTTVITESSTPLTKPNVAIDVDAVNSFEPTGASEYNILYYPKNLLANGSLGSRFPHAMGIFVNVNSKSKLGKYISDKDIRVTTYRLSKEPLDLTANTANQGIAQNTGTSTNPNSAQNFLNEAGAIAKFKRFTGCVMLPLPQDITTSYSAQYNTTGASGVLGLALNKVINGVSSVDELKHTGIDGIIGIGRDLVKQAAVNAAELANTMGEFGQVDNAGGMFDKVLGTIRNPRTEQVFEKIGIRSFTFTWHINITSVLEWNTIRKIISFMKENMHPELEKQETGTYMIMPNEFDLEFYEKEAEAFKESLTIPKIATSVLANLEVNYTPQGSWIAFEGTMIPPFVMIRAVFTEMEPLHRDMVRDIGSDAKNREFSTAGSVMEGASATEQRRGF